jgi:ribosomal-protein-alanine N-acetyltransferase
VEFSLRDFRREDFESLWSIDQRCFPPGIAYSRCELDSYILLPQSFTLVAEAAPPDQGSTDGGPQGQAVGFLVAEAGRGTGHIITIDVLTAARRYRVGSQLLQAAESRLRSAGCSSVYLETAVDNQSALAFYKHHHYFVVKTVSHYYGNGVDALVLQKDLLSRAQAS